MDNKNTTNNQPKTEVDEYTAKMDRMVNHLKRLSETDRKKRIRTTLIWTAVGGIVVAVSIYLMFKTSVGGFEGLSQLFF